MLHQLRSVVTHELWVGESAIVWRSFDVYDGLWQGCGEAVQAYTIAEHVDWMWIRQTLAMQGIQVDILLYQDEVLLVLDLADAPVVRLAVEKGLARSGSNLESGQMSTLFSGHGAG